MPQTELKESKSSSEALPETTFTADSEKKDPVHWTLAEAVEFVKTIDYCSRPDVKVTVLPPHVDNLAPKLLVRRRLSETIETAILDTFKITTHAQFSLTYYRLPYEPYYLDPRTNQMVILSDQKESEPVSVQNEIILVRSEKEFLKFYTRYSKTDLLKELGFFGKGISSLDQMKGLEFIELNSPDRASRRSG